MTADGRGRFITFEGGEGAGKSTQLRLLADRLRETGLNVLTTREPGGSDGAEEIRALLVSGATDRWDAVTEALLHTAARRDHLRAVVWPALAAGTWVLCDRFVDSTFAYQGYGHGMDRNILSGLTRLAIGDFAPDLTLVLDIPVEEGLRRAGAREGGEDRYERMGRDFHQRLRTGFTTIARDNPDRCALLDASGTAKAVEAAIWAIVAERLG